VVDSDPTETPLGPLRHSRTESRDLDGKPQALAQLVNGLLDLRSIRHLVLGIEQLGQELQGVLHARLSHVVGHVNRTVAVQPSRTNHLDLVAEVGVISLVKAVTSFARDHANVNTIQQWRLLLSLEGASLHDFLVDTLSKSLASLLAWTVGLLVKASVTAISTMSKHRVAPLAVDEEVSDFIENFAIWLQSVWLQQESLRILVLLGVGCQLPGALPLEICCLPMNCTAAKEGVMADLAQEFLPALSLTSLRQRRGSKPSV